ncbi:hypothetical protein ACS0TY_013134 [Phlomoides rotata]
MSKSQLRLLGLLLKKVIFGIVFQPLKKEKEEQFEPKITEQITAPFVRLVTEEGHDVVPLERAMAQAESLGMDLVEERSNQALMKKKKECRSGMEIMKFLQVDVLSVNHYLLLFYNFLFS